MKASEGTDIVLQRWFLGCKQTKTFLQKNTLPGVLVIWREASCTRRSQLADIHYKTEEESISEQGKDEDPMVKSKCSETNEYEVNDDKKISRTVNDPNNGKREAISASPVSNLILVCFQDYPTVPP